MAYKQPSSGPFKMMGSSPAKQEECYIDDNGEKKCPWPTQTEDFQEKARYRKKQRKERGEIVDPVGPVADKKITLPKLENDSKKLDYAKSTLKVK